MKKKDLLRERFSANPKRHYEVELFRERGFQRRRCSCGRYFWTLDPERSTCPDSTCQNYEFLGDPPTKRAYSYLEAWRNIERFFVKEGHESIRRYPVLCRWFPSLYFTAASIVDFYREEYGNISFEMPANPLIVPQRCLRFLDIPNVGVTGRHYTGFVMVGQHAIDDGQNGYWKDRCVDLDQRLLVNSFGIPEEKVVWVEDVWVGPNAFGPSLEYFVDGLEVGNAVFTQYVGTPDNHSRMENPVIDMGAGLERFSWLSQGTASGYEAVFGDVVGEMKAMSGLDYDEELFMRYSRLASSMDYTEMPDVNRRRAEIANKIGVSTALLYDSIRPFEAIYAIADHAGSLAFSIVDGGLPSNVGGGYNLRVILRRALSFIDEFQFPFSLGEVIELYARSMREMSPELLESLPEILRVVEVEEERYRAALQRAKKRVNSLLSRKSSFEVQELAKLYESEGVTPELIEEAARKEGKSVSLPEDFYLKTTEKHMSSEEKEEEKRIEGLEGLPGTILGFYEDDKRIEFEAEVLRVLPGNLVVLDRTYFYPRSGGEEPDHGLMGGSKVVDVDKVGDIVVHKLEKVGFAAGDRVECSLEQGRRRQLTIHHTATHIVNAAAREVLGNHIWQAGAHKDVDRARLDVTHYQRISPGELEEMEEIANQVIRDRIPVHKEFMPRGEAEERYGFRLYQGGAPPGDRIRVVDIEGVDVEACGGTHLDNTGECGLLALLGSERIQDGICRLEYVAGKAALREFQRNRELLNRASDLLSVEKEKLPDTVERFFQEWKERGKEIERLQDSLSVAVAKSLRSELESVGSCSYVGSFLEDVKPDVLAKAAERLATEIDVVVLLGTVPGRKRTDIVVALGEGGKDRGLDAGDIAGKLAEHMKGGGGGSPELGRGAGSKGDPREALSLSRDLVAGS